MGIKKALPLLFSCFILFGFFIGFAPEVSAQTRTVVEGAHGCFLNTAPSWDEDAFVACTFDQTSCDVTCQAEGDILEVNIRSVEQGDANIDELRGIYAGVRGASERTLEDYKELLRAYRDGCTMQESETPQCAPSTRIVTMFVCGEQGGQALGCARTPQECNDACQAAGISTNNCMAEIDRVQNCDQVLQEYTTEVPVDSQNEQQIAQLSDVCSGTYCTRDEVGRFMEEVRSECYNRGDCSLDDIEIVFINIAEFTLAIVGGLAFLMYVIGGMMWLLSGGNMDRVRKGKEIIKYATIGLVIVLGAYLATEFLLQDLLDVNRDVVEAPWD
jgi:hypothetical protein